MKRRFSETAEELVHCLDRKLLDDLYAFREQRLSHIESIVAQMSSMLSASSNNHTIDEATRTGIKELDNFSKNGYETIPDEIITDIFDLNYQLPKRKFFNQAQDRFRILEEDELHIKAGKAVKQLMRRAGKTEWTQKIKFPEVVIYHLLDAEWLFKKWLAAEEQLRMHIILELNEVLVHASENNQKHEQQTELNQVLKIFKNQIDEAQDSNKQNLRQARDLFVEHFLEIFDKVGTFERKNSFYSPKRVLRKKEETKKELEDYFQRWQQINAQLLRRTSAWHHFLIFSEELKQLTNIFLSDIDDIYEQLYFTPYRQLQDQVAKTRQKIAHADLYLAAFISDHEQQLMEFIDAQLLDPIRASLDHSEIERRRKMYAEQLVKRTGELPEELTLITNIDQSNDPPKIESQKIDRQTVVSHYLKKTGMKAEADNGSDQKEIKNEQLEELQEIKDLIEVNFEAALELSNDSAPEEDPRRIVDDALKRVQVKLESSLEKLGQSRQKLFNNLREGPDEFKDAVFELLRNGKVGEPLKSTSPKKSSDKTSKKTTKKETKWDQLRNHSALLVRFVRLKITSFYRRKGFSGSSGSKETQESEKPDISAYLAETARRINNLPFTYRRLYAFEKGPKKRYHVGLNEPIGDVRPIYEKWQEGAPAALAVTGEKGSGKSTFINLVNEELFSDEKVIQIHAENGLRTGEDLLALFNQHFGNTEFSSMEELKTFLNEKRDGHIIIFEGIQYVYLRNLKGYEALEQFLQLLTETDEHIFWMVSCSRYAWAFLSEAFHINHFFAHIVETDRLSDRQIKELILERNQGSGYKLVFNSSEDKAESTSKKEAAEEPSSEEKLTEEQKKSEQHQREKYFSQLAKMAHGNASSAMILWMRSIRDFDEEHCYIAPLEEDSYGMLEDVPPQSLFVLAALVLHEGLSPEALAATQNSASEESLLTLKRLQTQGMVKRSGEVFRVNPYMYRRLIKELKERNIFYS